MQKLAEAAATARRVPDLQAARAAWLAMSLEERAQVEEAEKAERAREFREGLRRSMRERCGLADGMWEHRLETYPAVTDSQKHALDVVTRFAQAFPGTADQPIRKGVYLHGLPGGGKSGLMQGLVQAILEKPRVYRVLYIPCIDIDRLRQSIDLEFAAREARLVVLDDIEKGMCEPGRFPTPGDGIIRRIIHGADRHRRPIVCVTSNMSIAQHAKDSKSFGSRLAGLTHEIHVIGPDMRAEAHENELAYWAR